MYLCNVMITTAVNIFKSFEETFDTETFKKRYSDLLELLKELLLTCSLICPFCREEGKQGHFILWGFYSRQISTGISGTALVRVQRIRCTCCRHTHAILPGETVPYSSFPAELQIRLIQARLDGDDASRDDLLEKYFSRDDDDEHLIWQRFKKKWRERSRKAGASMDSPVSVITEKCVTLLRQQFMQAGPAPVFLLEALAAEDALKIPLRDLPRQHGPYRPRP